MGILSPFIWPLYKSGLVIPIMGIILIIGGITINLDLIGKMVLTIVGFLLLIGGVVLVKNWNRE